MTSFLVITIDVAIVLVLALFVFGLFFIIKGGDFLVRAALSLNKISGINQVIIGATFVSVATTLPEVFVSIFAVAADNHGIAVGNALGAMTANIALVLALPIAFLPSGVKRGEVFGKSIFLLVVTVIVFLFALNLQVSWYEGTILLAAFAVFIIYNIFVGTRRCEPVVPKPLCRSVSQEKTANRYAYLKIAAGFIIGQVMLIFGAFTLVENGEKLAHLFGISETVVGFTIIAIGTSLPELTTAIISIRRKSGGLAVGNVIGANVINCTLLLGVCGIIGDIKGVSLPVSRETVFIAIPVLIALTLIAVLPMLIRGRAYKWQGFLLLAAYAAYVSYLAIAQPV